MIMVVVSGSYLAIGIMNSGSFVSRWLLPVHPFLIILIAVFVYRIIKNTKKYKLIWRWLMWVIIICLLGWYVVGVVINHPHHLAYFNELVGGRDEGYKYLVQSNLDWGQDMKRINRYLEDNNIDKVYYLSSYEGSYPEYYFGDKYQPDFSWDIETNESGALLVGVSFYYYSEARGQFIDYPSLVDLLKDYEQADILYGTTMLYYLD